MATAGKTLSPGAPADVILVNLRQANAAPVHDIDSALVQCCHAGDVNTVIVAGKLLLNQKRILALDEDALLRECEQVVAGLRRRAGLS
jgi:cytosine/adenosine deaminase-related metal-dependent hydrolase